jgi:hypothetical protein
LRLPGVHRRRQRRAGVVGHEEGSRRWTASRTARRPSGRILGAIRSLYEYQTITFLGSYRDTGILEDYTAQVRGEPIHCVALITRNAAGQPQHLVANYRPRSSLLLLSRLVREKLADTPYAEHFAAGES